MYLQKHHCALIGPASCKWTNQKQGKVGWLLLESSDGPIREIAWAVDLWNWSCQPETQQAQASQAELSSVNWIFSKPTWKLILELKKCGFQCTWLFSFINLLTLLGYIPLSNSPSFPKKSQSKLQMYKISTISTNWFLSVFCLK